MENRYILWRTLAYALYIANHTLHKNGYTVAICCLISVSVLYEHTFLHTAGQMHTEISGRWGLAWGTGRRIQNIRRLEISASCLWKALAISSRKHYNRHKKRIAAFGRAVSPICWFDRLTHQVRRSSYLHHFLRKHKVIIATINIPSWNNPSYVTIASPPFCQRVTNRQVAILAFILPYYSFFDNIYSKDKLFMILRHISMRGKYAPKDLG